MHIDNMGYIPYDSRHERSFHAYYLCIQWDISAYVSAK